MVDDATRQELNRLYWESDRSVGDIAETLGMSRRSLYDGIDPRPAGAPCPACGADLVFRNRTAAERREAECPECGRMEELGAGEPAEDPGIEQEVVASRLAPLPTRSVPARGRNAPAMGGALLAGLALGAAAGYLLRRR